MHVVAHLQIFDLMCMTLGGRVAEAITFKKVTTGAVATCTCMCTKLMLY